MNQSATVNMAQLTGSADGQVIVPAYDYQSFFTETFRKLKGIKKLHYLRFKSDSPGCVYVRERVDSCEVVGGPQVPPRTSCPPGHLVLGSHVLPRTTCPRCRDKNGRLRRCI